MKKFLHDWQNLPLELPLLAVQGAVLLPRSQLPLPLNDLNHLEMIFDMLKAHQMVGIVQPMPTQDTIDEISPIFKTGCVGKIIDLQETENSQFIITLKGIRRFKVIEELEYKDGCRHALVNYDDYPLDGVEDSDFSFDRARFLKALEQYFRIVDINPNWHEIDRISNQKLIAALTIVCPLEPREKQALLEAATPKEQSQLMMTLLELAGREGASATCH